MLITAFVMGFAGSLHCVGMCSPLAMAVASLNSRAMLNRLLYNSGRILMYGILGAVVGTIGWALPIGGFQNLLSVLLGVSLLFVGIVGISRINIPWLTPILQGATARLKMLFGKFLRQKNHFATFILGTLNGMLPCGLTFLALTYCLSLNNPVDGFTYMIVFGSGTLPVMLGLTSVIMRLVTRFKISVDKLTTTMLILSGCLLIARVFLFHEHAFAEEHGVIDIILCQ